MKHARANEPIPMLPPALADEVRAAGTPPAESEADRRLFEVEIAKAMAQAEEKQRSRFRVQRLVAGVLLVVLFVLIARNTASRHGGQGPPSPGTLRRSDLDGDGIVDVRDILLLSSAMRARVATVGSTSGRAWDVNGDGAVDDADLASLAAIVTRTRVIELEPKDGERLARLTLSVDARDLPLGAVQAWVRPEGGRARVVGVEGGSGFSRVWYDPAALGAGLDGKLVIAALADHDSPPSGEITLATIGVMVDAEAPADFLIGLDASAGPDGEPLAARLRLRLE